MISQYQYQILISERDAIEAMINVGCSRFKREWLVKVRDILSQAFKAPPFDISCNSCIARAMQQVANLIAEYESSQIEAESKPSKNQANEKNPDKSKASEKKYTPSTQSINPG